MESNIQHFSERIVNITTHYLPIKGEAVQYVVESRLPNDDLTLTTITVRCDSEDSFVSAAIEHYLRGLQQRGSVMLHNI